MDSLNHTAHVPDSSFRLAGAMDLRANTMETVLLAVAELAVQTCSAASGASVTLMTGDRPGTIASTGATASALDETQYEQGYGPCLDAVLAQAVMAMPDARTESRWPKFAPVAVSHGILSSLSLPVPVVDSLSAALNVYATVPDGFDEADRQSLLDLVGFAGVAIANMHIYESSATLVQHLRIAAESRAVIDQARGILMARHHCSPDEAFAMLRTTSQRSNRKIRDLARELVEEAGQGSAD
jgi:GAF domain-containing protein